MLSIVSPVYRAENIIDELVRRIIKEVSAITTEFEIILVEDGGPDNSWQKIEENCAKDHRVIGIKLSRNFGQHYAITAGLDAAKGDFIFVMDCDLQDDPADLRKVYAKISEGFDVVFTQRLNRKHSVWKSALSFLYKKLFGLVSDTKYAVENGSLFMLTRKVLDATKQLRENHRQIGQIIRWVGFKTGFVSTVHHDRYEGKSSYNFAKLLAMVIEGWISHSDRLLRLSIYTGLFFSSFSLLSAFTILVLYFTQGFVMGWTSVIVATLFSAGVILLSLGAAGLYIGKIFEQSKNRPLYVIDQTINL